MDIQMEHCNLEKKVQTFQAFWWINFVGLCYHKSYLAMFIGLQLVFLQRNELSAKPDYSDIT
jgi:hypothetical protein